MPQIKPRKKVVLIDDDFINREVLKIFLGKIKRSNKINLDVFTSSNGLEGLGLAIATKPDLIVIDSTLPRYSGRELVDFLTSNPKFTDSNSKVIITYDKIKPKDIPSNFYLVSKNDKNFLPKLLIKIGKYLSLPRMRKSYSRIQRFHRLLSLLLGQQAGKWATLAQELLSRTSDQRLLTKILRTIGWAGTQFIANTFLVLMYICCGRVKEGNIDQTKIDRLQFRVRYYPASVTIFALLVNILFQVLLLATGGLAILGFKFESIFAYANYKKELDLNIEDSTYNKEKIGIENGEIFLLKVPTEEEEQKELLPPEINTSIPEEDSSEEKDKKETETTQPEEDGDSDSLEEESTQVETEEQDSQNSVTKQESNEEKTETEEVYGVSTENDQTPDTEIDGEATQQEPQAETQITYYTDAPSITFNQEVEYSTLLAILEESSFNTVESSLNAPDETLSKSNYISYQLSPNGTDWYYFSDENKWELSKAGWVSSNIVQKINENISTFTEQAAGNSLYLRAYLHSDGNTPIRLKKLTVKRELDFVDEIREVEEIEPQKEPSITLEDMTPIVLNAAYSNGHKVLGGRVDIDQNIDIPDEELGFYYVQIYYTASRNTSQAATTKENLIGETNLDKIVISGITQYVFEMKRESVPGGYVTAQVVYRKEDGNQKESVLSAPVKNSTFTVVETGDQSDANPGDGACDRDPGTAGFQCTMRAAIEEATSTGNNHDINFNIPKTDSNCLSFTDNGDTGYNPDAAEVGCLSGSADSDISWWRISPATELPPAERDLHFYGDSQPGFITNTTVHPDPSLNGQPVIELTCNGHAHCFTVESYGADVLLNGFVINSATSSNVYSVNSRSGGPFIDSCYIGTDISGTKTKGSTNYGIEVLEGDANVYGAADSRRSIIIGQTSAVFTDYTSYTSSFYSFGNIYGQLKNGTVVSSDIVININGKGRVGLGHSGDPSGNIIAGGNTGGGLCLTSPSGTSSIYAENNIIKSNSYGIDIEGGLPTIRANKNTIINNTQDGIRINDGTGIISENQIYDNGDNGVEITGSSTISTNQNSIYSNGELGIDLEDDGVTPNDLGDTDTGPNNLQNYPEIVYTNNDTDSTFIQFQLSAEVGYYRVEFFYSQNADASGFGEGQNYLCYTNINYTGGPFGYFTADCDNSTFPNAPAPERSLLSATVTKCSDSSCSSFVETSEFSEVRPVGAMPIINSTGDSNDDDTGDTACYTGGTNSEGEPECTLRAAIEETNASSKFDDIEFNIPESDPNCLSFVDNGGSGYDQDNSEVHCLAPTADPDIKWWRITPSTELPAADRDKHLYANTQPGFIESTSPHPEPLNGQPVIEVSCPGLSHCFTVESWGADLALYGFVFNSATDANIYSFESGAGGPFLRSSYVGTDISGTRKKGTTDYGVDTLDGDTVVTAYIDSYRNLVIGDTAAFHMNTTGTPGSGNIVFLSNLRIGVLNDGTVVTSDAAIIIDGITDFRMDKAVVSGGTTYGGVLVEDTVGSEWSGVIIGNSIIRNNRHGIYMEKTPPPPYGLAASQIKNSTITNNTEKGITILDGDNPFLMSQNSIYNNGDIGIDLEDDGVTTNDSGDSDTGVNNLQNFPELTWAFSDDDNTDIEFDLDTEAGDYKVEFFYSTSEDPSGYGEGGTYLCNTIINHTGSGSESFSTNCDNENFPNAPAPVNTLLTATVLKCEDSGCSDFTDTSEFSEGVIVAGQPVVNSTGNDGDINPGDKICYSGYLNSEGSPECTLQAAIDETNALSGNNSISFNIPESDPGYNPGKNPAGVWTIEPTTRYRINKASGGIFIDGFSQPGSSPNTNPINEPDNAVHRIEIYGGNLPQFNDLFTLTSDDNRARGLSITGDPTKRRDVSGAFRITGDNNRIDGCYIGIAPDGVTDMDLMPTGGDLLPISSDNNVIGSNNDGEDDNQERNLISNGIRGVSINGNNNLISGNFFGLKRDGTTPFTSNPTGTGFANDAIGIYANSPVDGLTITNNVFGSQDRALSFYPGSYKVMKNILFENNLIGTDCTGQATPPGHNNNIGVWTWYNGEIGDIENFQIKNNVFGGLKMAAIALEARAEDTEPIENLIIEDNFIGTDETETVPLPNWDGIYLGIGDNIQIKGNIIENNQNLGINISGPLDPAHTYYPTAPRISSDSTDINIQDNEITFNGANGILVDRDGSTGNTFRDNRIYNNSDIPIDIVGGDEDTYGVTANDTDDSDSGPNNLQNYPIITEIEYFSGGTYKIHGDLDGKSSEADFDIEVCVSEGHPSGHGGCTQSLGITEASSPWEILVTIPGNNGTEDVYFSSLATNSSGSTSEFGETILATEENIISYEIELIYPIGGIELSDNTPQLDWNHAQYEGEIYPHIDHYEVFIDGVFYTTTPANTTEFQIVTPLSAGPHRWEVVAYQEDNFEIGRSVVETFTILSAPRTIGETEYEFIPLYPVDVTIDDTTPNFDWTNIDPASGTDEYNLYIDNKMISTAIDVESSEYQTTEDEELEEGTHTWYVVALDTDGEERTEVARTYTAEFEIDLPDLPTTGEEEDDEDGPEPSGTSIIEQVNKTLPVSVPVFVGTVTAIALSGISLLELPSLFMFWIDKFLILIGLRKKGSEWGIVYNSVTKEPIPRAVVRLFKGARELVETKVTDVNGRFYFVAEKAGNYDIIAQHRSFKFPTRIIIGNSDGVYKNIYRGGKYSISSERDFVEISIPIDPKEISKFKLISKKILNYIKALLTFINPFLLVAGVVINFYFFSTQGKFVSLILGLINLLLLVLFIYEVIRDRGRWGKVVDKTGKPISGVKVGLYDTKYDKVITERVTDKKGQFSMLVPGDQYYLRVADIRYSIDDEKNKKGYLVGKRVKQDIFISQKMIVRKTDLGEGIVAK